MSYEIGPMQDASVGSALPKSVCARGRTSDGCMPLYNQPTLIFASWRLLRIVHERVTIHCGSGDQLRQDSRTVKHIIRVENGTHFEGSFKCACVFMLCHIADSHGDPFQRWEFFWAGATNLLERSFEPFRLVGLIVSFFLYRVLA